MRKTNIVYSIYLGCVIIILAVVAWCHPFTNELISTNGAAYEQQVNSVAFGYQLDQQFIPIENGLSAIDIYVNTTECSTESGKLQFSIWNQLNEPCFIKDIPLSELPEYGWYRVLLDTQLQKGEQYRLVLESVDCVDLGPQISFFAANQAAAPEQITDTLIYAGQEVSNAALRIRFYYEVPVKWYIYGVYVLFAAIIGMWMISFFNKEIKDGENE